ncbi:acyltransferase [Bradyrhizobium sp. 40]|uniref:acyltransferase family protein n=1 Tax=Bradyrhizobium sp. 40 TaxID=2782674 RepID=UPI001FFF05F8|nr:acyltransferase [Bradyrhizobium sp. 40]UPJ41144.1 acyltransferase [Bradyrhizobium sp. 40]
MHRLQNLDALRGLAACVVLIQHLFGHIWRQMPASEIGWLKSLGLDYFDWGRFGVVLFFLISGYVIPLSFSGPNPIWKFVVSRLFRLYPAYWLAVLAATAALSATGATVGAKQILANLTMAYPLFREPAISGVYWTLIVELAFYGVAFVLFVCGSLERPTMLAGVAVVGISSAAVPAIMLRFGYDVPVSFLGYNLSFLLLGSLCRLSLAGVDHARSASIVVALSIAATLPLVCGVFGQIGPGYSNAFPIGAIASVVAAFTVFILSWSDRFAEQSSWVLRLGAWSYSLYLFHEPIASMVELLVTPETATGAFLFLFLALGLSVFVASMVFRYVEATSIRLGRRLAKWRTDRAPLPA